MGATFLDLYKLTGEILGEGSEGKVETCKNVFTGIEYAVKIIEKRPGSYNRSKVLKEIEIYHLCRGMKNIIQLIEFFEEADYFYLVFEKIEDEISYNKKCDMWSLGVIMYILLCGYAPFQARCDDLDCDWDQGGACETCQRILFNNIQAGNVIFPEQHWSKVSSEAKDLIQKLLVLDLSSRFTAEQHLKDLGESSAVQFQGGRGSGEQGFQHQPNRGQEIVIGTHCQVFPDRHSGAATQVQSLTAQSFLVQPFATPAKEQRQVLKIFLHRRIGERFFHEKYLLVRKIELLLFYNKNDCLLLSFLYYL